MGHTFLFSEPSKCGLCEKAADIQFHPCKHVAMCHPCRSSVRAVRKCLECKVSLQLHVQHGGDHLINDLSHSL